MSDRCSLLRKEVIVTIRNRGTLSKTSCDFLFFFKIFLQDYEHSKSFNTTYMLTDDCVTLFWGQKTIS